MINVDVLIARLKETTGYSNVSYLRELQPDLFEEGEIPYIRMNYFTVTPPTPIDPTFASYTYTNEDLHLTYVLELVCDVSKFPEVWENIFGVGPKREIKFLGWHYTGNPSDTAIALGNGKVIAISQGRIKFQTLIVIGSPVYN
jgi:hypothetical protein